MGEAGVRRLTLRRGGARWTCMRGPRLWLSVTWLSIRWAGIQSLPYQILIEAGMFLDRLSDGLRREMPRAVFLLWRGDGRRRGIQTILPTRACRMGVG
ncbi:hypothetical protein XH84_32790 [Bradyrhizobium nanningense]|nr:hypothetical protein XH84_32790 [Bradyrhizobium nanningense]